jgi:succinate dehydrogenase/fumarate reductase-like Fe-S protein
VSVPYRPPPRAAERPSRHVAMTEHETRRPAAEAQAVAREATGSLSKFERLVLCGLVHTACLFLWAVEHLPAPTGHRRLALDRSHRSTPPAC